MFIIEFRVYLPSLNLPPYLIILSACGVTLLYIAFEGKTGIINNDFKPARTLDADLTQSFAIVECVSFSDPDYLSWKEEGWYFKRFG